MLNFGKSILYTLTLLAVVLSMVGVNVVHWHCIHTEQQVWEIRIFPAEGEENEGCQEHCLYGEDCPFIQKHVFFKLNELPETERGVQLGVPTVAVCECSGEIVCFSFFAEKQRGCIRSLRTGPPPREFLCTYLC